MGTSGFGILQNDTAFDVHREYLDFYNLGTPTDEIRKKLDRQYPWAKCLDDESVDYWLALALIQWECRALDRDVLANVEQIIEGELDRDLWDAKDYPKRKAILHRFLTKLRKPKGVARKRVPPRYFEAPFKKGDCIVFKHADGFYGGVLCLGTSDKPQEVAWNIFALLRIHQKRVPRVADFLDSHLLVKNWGEVEGEQTGLAEDPEPAIEWLGVSTVRQFHDAQKHIVIGSIPVHRAFGEVVYGFGFSWRWDDTYRYQQDWERKRRVKPDLSYPVRKIIRIPRQRNWAEIGERFVYTQHDNDDWRAYRRGCKAFRSRVRSMKLNRPKLISLIAQYACTSDERAQNRIEEILSNAK